MNSAPSISQRFPSLPALILSISLASAIGHAQTPSYNDDIKPLLSDRCYKCHGPDAAGRKAKLRLDTEQGAKASTRDALAIITPGHPDKSELYRRIISTDPDEKMPPPESNLALLPSEIERLKTWIQQGAKWENHWAFITPRSPEPPPTTNTTWARTPIDRFILAKLEARGLTPSPPATKEKLIRRVTFDLIGLPPTLEELDHFLADDSPQAYDKLVDRLLERKEYGERMTSDWLDLARYSDTYGYQVDRDRFVWPWRDWVIKAFNENLPYDDFLIWQLAGDLLPNATTEQILATTFNRLHPQKVEGGSTPEEFRVEYVADRTHTFGTAFLGLTVECMRCHDHKYDPFSQSDYYRFFAFFNNIDEAGLYSYFTPAVPTPTLLLPDETQKAAITQIERQIAEAEDQLEKVSASRQAEFNNWLTHRPSEPLIPNRLAHFPFDDIVDGKLANTVAPDKPASTPAANSIVPGRIGNAVQLTGDDPINTSLGNFRRYQPFSFSLWINTPDLKERAIIFHRSQAWTDAGSRGYQIMIEEGKLSASLIHFWPGNALRVRTTNPIPIDTWLHLAVTYNGSSRASGLKIFLNGEPASAEIVRDNLYKNITGGGGDNITLGERMRDRGFTNGKVDEFQVFDRELSALEIAHLHDNITLQETLSRPVNQLSADQRSALFGYYLSTLDEPYRQQLAALEQLRAERSKATDNLQEIMVMREMPQEHRRPTYRLNRGAYDAPAEPVDPATPGALLPFPDSEPRNRLGLARWLTHPDHPLTPRVAANRLWQQCFGQGLVRTPEDFGSQGQPPTHPELLDWLARDLVDHGWNIKRALKQIVASATYQQQSAAPRELLSLDPENRLLARAPRYRLSAEMIRDNALAVSGLLVRNVGGPSVRPYELAVSFKPITPDKGPGLYRRSLYTFWKRTGPAPVMMALDASKRDVCSVKRERTATPLQALVLLNDPQFVETARVFAMNMLVKHPEKTDALTTDVFRSLTSRRPTKEERVILDQLYREQLDHFTTNPAAAAELLKTGHAPTDPQLSVPRLAATTLLVSTLMNHTECIRKE